MDGTLLDTVPLISRAWEFALRSLGFNVRARDLEPLIGLPASKIAEAVGAGQSSLVELSGLRASYLEEHVGEVRAFPEVPQVLRELRAAGLRLAVATSLASGLARAFLGSAGILETLDAVVGGESVGKGKPDPEIFLEAARALSISPREAVIVGDRDYDVAPARRMGSFSVLVVRGLYCPSERPDAVIPDLRGLLELLRIK